MPDPLLGGAGGVVKSASLKPCCHHLKPNVSSVFEQPGMQHQVDPLLQLPSTLVLFLDEIAAHDVDSIERDTGVV